MEFREMTKAEEQLMQILWKLEKAFVKELVAELPDPKPAYNTVSTIIRIMESKGLIGYEAFGRTHRYFPLISKSAYKKHETQKLLGNYFGDSVQDMLTYFVEERKLNLGDVGELLKMIDNMDNKKG